MAAQLKAQREALSETQKQVASQQQEIEALKQQLKTRQAAVASHEQDSATAIPRAATTAVPFRFQASSHAGGDAGGVPAAREGRHGAVGEASQWLEREYPSAASSLREGLAEMFTVNRLGLSPGLMRCLVSTNVIESPTSGVRLRTRRVCRWRDGKMVLRWAAATWLMTEKNFRRMMGYRDLWMLEAALGRKSAAPPETVA